MKKSILFVSLIAILTFFISSLWIYESLVTDQLYNLSSNTEPWFTSLLIGAIVSISVFIIGAISSVIIKKLEHRKVFISAIILLVLVVIFFEYSSKNFISEEQAAEIAIQFTINDGRKDWLRTECARAEIIDKNFSTVTFNIHEVHNDSCAGDPGTSPVINSISVNLKTGKVFDPFVKDDYPIDPM